MNALPIFHARVPSRIARTKKHLHVVVAQGADQHSEYGFSGAWDACFSAE